MARPFFSIVIPTKNRSFLVGYAIQSVRRQSFDDYEIVIADNDDTEETRQVVGGFQDPRIRYFRSGNLSMPDNWEFGCSKAEGEYIAILEDKAALKTRSLERIYEAIERDRYGVVSWLHDGLDDTGPTPFLYSANGTGDVNLFSSEQVLEIFVNSTRGRYKRIMPRGLNSCVHCQVVDKIRNGAMRRLCPPVAPDYTMAYLQLAYSDHVLNIDDALVVIGGLRYSNGRSFILKGDLVKQFTQELGGDARIFYDNVPIKATTVSGTLYNDYVKVRSVVGGRLSRFPLNLTNYFAECYRDIQISKGLGVDMSDEETAWNKALSEQSEFVKKGVRRALAGNREGIMEDLKNVGRRFGLNKPWRLIRRYLSKQEGSSVTAPSTPLTFSNVLEYIEWEDRNSVQRTDV